MSLTRQCRRRAGPSAFGLIRQVAQLEIDLGDLIMPPFHLELGTGDLAAINNELERLREGREYFMEWVQEFREQEPADRRGLSPWAFLTAWNDSTARIIYLLRERRGLTGHKETEFDPIMEAVFDEIEQHEGVKALDALAEGRDLSGKPNGATGGPDLSGGDPSSSEGVGEGAESQ